MPLFLSSKTKNVEIFFSHPNIYYRTQKNKIQNEKKGQEKVAFSKKSPLKKLFARVIIRLHF